MDASCENDNIELGVIYEGNISCPAMRLSVSQEILCFVELVIRSPKLINQNSK
jgi:hypothetical protein